MKIAPLVYWPLLGVASLIAGIGAGSGIHSFIPKEIVSYDGNDKEYRPDIESIKTKYLSLSSTSKDYTKLEPHEALNMAYYLFSLEERNESHGVGFTSAMFGIKQGINTSTAHVGKRYMEESISTGTLSIYNRMYQEGDTTTLYWGNSSDYSKDTPEEMPNADYAKRLGKNLSDPLIYTVSEKTIRNEDASKLGLSKIEKSQKGYQIDVELDPNKSVIRYQKQMQNISELASPPLFDYVHLSVFTDENLSLKYCIIHEKYTVESTKPIHISSSCTAELTTVYLHGATSLITFVEPTDPLYDYPDTQEALLNRYSLN